MKPNKEVGNIVIVYEAGLLGINKALGRLRKKLRAEGTMKDWFLASRYEKPSVRKREKRAAHQRMVHRIRKGFNNNSRKA